MEVRGRLREETAIEVFEEERVVGEEEGSWAQIVRRAGFREPEFTIREDRKIQMSLRMLRLGWVVWRKEMMGRWRTRRISDNF